MSKGIEKENLPYKIGATFMRKWFFSAYPRREHADNHKIPQDGAVIFGPNHSNAAIDAIALMMVHQGPAVFVARADIFRSKIQAFLLNFCKIMPIMRMRDGYENLAKNKEIMDESVRVLGCNVPFVIMSEGTHRTMRNQLPIVKGMFRIAIQAHEALNGKKDVYIVPFGLDYGSYYRYRTSLLTQIGDAINVSEFLRSNAEMSQAEQINVLRQEFAERLQQVHLMVPNNGCYEELYESCLIGGEPICEQQYGPKFSLLQRRNADQKIANTLEQLRSENTEVAECLQEVKNFEQERKQQGISANSFNIHNRPAAMLTKALFLLLTLPYAIFSAIMASPMLIINAMLTKKMKDFAFHNSVRYVVEWFFVPLITLITAITTFCTLPWWIAALWTVLTPCTHLFAHTYYKQARLLRSDYRLFKNKPLLSKLEHLRGVIIKYCA